MTTPTTAAGGITVDEVNRDYITVPEARATIFMCSRQRYHQLIDEGKVRSVNVGPHVFVHRADVERWATGGSPWLDALHRDGYLTIAEAVTKIGVVRGTLVIQERNGAIQMERRDGRIVVSRAEVDAYLANHRGRCPLRGPEGDAIRAMGLAALQQRAATKGAGG